MLLDIKHIECFQVLECGIQVEQEQDGHHFTFGYGEFTASLACFHILEGMFLYGVVKFLEKLIDNKINLLMHYFSFWNS